MLKPPNLFRVGIREENSNIISWMYDEKPTLYNDQNLPEKLLPAPILAPWHSKFNLKALSNVSMPKGTSSMGFLDPVQLRNRSGQEVQEIYNQMAPTFLVCVDRIEIWSLLLYIHWITVLNGRVLKRSSENMKISTCPIFVSRDRKSVV